MSLKKIKRLCLPAIAVCLMVLQGCANQPKQESAALFNSYSDFRPGPEGGVDLIWSAPQIKNYASLKQAFVKYDSIMLDRVFIVLDESTKSNLDEEEIKVVSNYLLENLKERVSRRYKIVESPSNTTLRLSLAVSNIETANPILATTSSILPVGIGISVISWVVTGEHTNTGNATMELLISDALTGDFLIAAVDRRSGNKDFSTLVDNTDDVKDAINGWLDQLGSTIHSIAQDQ